MESALETALSELPLTFFTTLCSIGAGAFVILALVLLLASPNGEQTKKINRLTLVPLCVVIVGFIAAFFHLASPLHAIDVFNNLGSSPMSNEIFVGVVFVVLAIIYFVLALLNVLRGVAQKICAVIVGIVGLVFACFCGLAYAMETIPSWDNLYVPLEMIGFALLGGAALGVLVYAQAGAFGKGYVATEESHTKEGQVSVVELTPDQQPAHRGLRATTIVFIVIGLILSLVGMFGQIILTATFSSSLQSGADLVMETLPFVITSAVCLIVCAVSGIVALTTRHTTAWAIVGVVLALVGIFLARLVFYGLELSVAL